MKRGNLHVLGVRGSTPVARADALRTGGNTSALALRLDDRMVLFDAGTGIDALGGTLAGDPALPRTLEFFITHGHLDHVLGLPRFAPCYHPDFTLRFHSGRDTLPAVRDAVNTLFAAPLWPVPVRDLAARIHFVEAPERWEHDGFTITHAPLHHPGGATGYRVTGPGASAVLVTDYEHPAEGHPPELVALCHQATHLIYDAHWTPEEYPKFAGWGHSTWEQAVSLARAAQAKRIWLYHHRPERTDAALDALVARAQTVFPACDAAREGLVLPLA